MINIGSSKISEMYIGSTKIGLCYLGSSIVYQLPVAELAQIPEDWKQE